MKHTFAPKMFAAGMFAPWMLAGQGRHIRPTSEAALCRSPPSADSTLRRAAPADDTLRRAAQSDDALRRS